MRTKNAVLCSTLLVGLAFAVSAAVEYKLEDTYPHAPDAGEDQGRLNFHNGVTGLEDYDECSITVHFIDDDTYSPRIELAPQGKI